MALVNGSLERPLRVARKAKDCSSPDCLNGTTVAKFTIAEDLFLVIPRSVFRDKTNHNGKFSEPFNGIEVTGELKIENKNFIIIKVDHHKDSKNNNQICPLTKREIQIVMLVANGKVNKEIADRLSISEYTVSTHLRRIFAKLGVDSRAAMIYRWTQLF